MSTRVASLPMYNLPETAAVNTAFWRALSDELQRDGVADVPGELLMTRPPVPEAIRPGHCSPKPVATRCRRSIGGSTGCSACRRLFDSDNWLEGPIREAFPDIAGQGFFEVLDEVDTIGVTKRADAAPVRYRQPGSGEEKTRYNDFVYAPFHSMQDKSVG